MFNSMAYYDRVIPNIYGKHIFGNGIKTYCKIIDYNWNDPNNYKRTFSFGTIMKEWCLTAAYRNAQSDYIYIDRVEAYNSCFISEKPFDDSTAQFIRLALYVLYKSIPDINRFTLKDDSHIYCNGKDYGPKISLAYETILKYNQTWYQYKFGAILDGYISYTTDIHSIEPVKDGTEHILIPIVGIDTLFIVVSHSIMSRYLKSLIILDTRCDTYDDIINECPYLKNYKMEYESASSPRNFLTQIRVKYNKEQYCLNIKDWLHSYMEFLGIIIYYDAWYIPVTSIQIPKGFKENEMNRTLVNQILKGGKTRKRHKRIDASRKQEHGWGIIPFHRTSDNRAMKWDDI
jgi:hypothetical protein